MRMVSAITAALLLLSVMVTAPLDAARLSQGNPEEPAAAIGQDTRVTIDFRDVDIHTIAKFISDLTGRNFLFDRQVSQKVTLFSPTPVTPDEAYRLFEQVLRLNGFTTVPTSTATMIVPSLKARTMDIETRPGLPQTARTNDDRMVTQIIRLNHADAGEVMNLLKPLVDKTGAVMAYESGNTLLVTDYASNIDRLIQIISAVDIGGEGTKLTVIPLKYAAAKDLATELQTVLQARAGRPRAQGAEQTFDYKVVADERTNSLIVLARPNEISMILDLTRKLDLPNRRGSDRVHVVFLEHAVAEDMAKTLSDLTSGGGSGGSTPIAGAAPVQGAPSPVLISEPVYITADKPTNALIIRAARPDYMVLEEIIGKLDIQRSQVLVEGVIMEVSLKRANALGAEWRLLDFPEEGGGITGLGGTNLPTGSSSGLINQLATQPFAGPAGLILGAAEGTISWNGTSYINIGALIQALEQDSDVNILSTPHLLTMDNEEAKIIVGEERPFLQSSMNTSTGAVTPTITNTYEFKDLGLMLTITPHITQGDNVKLKIFQQLKSFVSEAETGAVTSTKREADTMVLVKDRESVVIGGLISDERRQDKSQIPCLGDIPLLGWAAKRRNQSNDKVNLLILIKPTIIRTSTQLKDATERKKKETDDASKPPEETGEQFPARGINILKDKGLKP